MALTTQIDQTAMRHSETLTFSSPNNVPTTCRMLAYQIGGCIESLRFRLSQRWDVVIRAPPQQCTKSPIHLNDVGLNVLAFLIDYPDLSTRLAV